MTFNHRTGSGVLRKKKRQRPEDDLQIAVAEFLDYALPEDAIWWHTPNGGARSKAEAKRFKAMGVKPGVPDVVIFMKGSLYAIELKAARGVASMDQIDMLGRLQAAGAFTAICRSLGAVEAKLDDWHIELRARIAA